MRTCITLILLCIICSCNNKKSIEKARLLYETGKQQEEAEQPDSAIVSYQSALKLLGNSHEYALLGEINNQIGDVLQKHRLCVEATKFYNEAYRYSIKLEDKSLASKSMREIGKNFLFDFKGDTLPRVNQDSAFVYFSKAYQLINQVNDEVEVACIYNNLSGLYYEYHDYEKSMEYIQKAIQASKDEKILYYNYYSKGALYIAFQKYDSATYYFKLSLPSKSLFTQCGAYNYLYKIACATESADSVRYLQEYIRLNEAISVANRTPELSSTIIKQKLNQTVEEKDNEYIIWIIVVLLVCCILFILYRKYFNKKIFHLQKEITTKSQILQNELKESQWVGNYVELKALKESEEVQVIDRMVQISIDCIRNLKKDRAYQNMCDLLSTSTKLSAGERNLVYQMMKRYFNLYVKELSHYVPLADEDYFLCCMALADFSTKQCALCRGVGDTAIRVRRKRIKEKMGIYFHSDKLYDSIFGKKG